MEKIFIQKRNSVQRLLMSFWLVCCLVNLGYAQTPTTDLTTHQPATLPAGTTLEWHTGATSGSALVASPAAVAPGLYYAFLNYGAGCFSSPSPLRVLTNTCPSTTIDLSTGVDATQTPVGSTVKYYTNSTLTTEITGTAITAAGAGTYYAANVDGTGCKSNASVIVTVATSCSSVVVLANPNTATTSLNTLVNIPVLGNDTNTGVAATTTNSTLTITTPPTAAQGVATVKPDGTIDFTPASGFVGTATFIYTLCDKVATTVCDTALVTVNVGCPVVAAPVPSPTSKNNVCPVTTVDLTSTQPALVAGITYEWHTVSSNPTAANLVASPTAVTAGLYYLYAKNTGGCYSVASVAVTANVTSCGGACVAGTTAPVLIKN